VTLYISSGAETEGVTVPDVIGASGEDANARLAALGLRTATTSEASAGAPAGSVVRSDPPAGTTVEAGSLVRLVVSSGLVRVPDVVGLPRADAVRELKALGLQSTSRGQPSEQYPSGIVIATEPRADTEVEPGSSVQLTVSCGASCVG
jgi:serine/threonine-protein kinase